MSIVKGRMYNCTVQKDKRKKVWITAGMLPSVCVFSCLILMFRTLVDKIVNQSKIQ